MNRSTTTTRRHRRQLHFLFWTGVTIAITGVLALTLPDSTPDRQFLSLALAYTSLVAILAALVLGPFNVLKGRRNPLSTDIRRDAGLAAAVTGVAHTVIGATNHFGGDVIAYFVTRRELSLGAIRRGAFGLGAWVGVGAILVIAVLAVISSDAAMRRIGRARWKRVQRSNYVLIVLVAAHTALFWVANDRGVSIIAFTALVLAAVGTLQVAGAWRTAAQRKTSQPADAP